MMHVLNDSWIENELVWIWHGIWMGVCHKGWHEIYMHDKYILGRWNMMCMWLGRNSMNL